MYLYTYTLDIRQHKTELDVSSLGFTRWKIRTTTDYATQPSLDIAPTYQSHIPSNTHHDTQTYA